MGGEDENCQSAAFPPRFIHSGSGAVDRANFLLRECHAPRASGFQHDYPKSQYDTSQGARPPVLNTLVETRGSASSLAARCRGGNPDRVGDAPSQTQTSRDVSAIRGDVSRNRGGVGNRESYTINVVPLPTSSMPSPVPIAPWEPDVLIEGSRTRQQFNRIRRKATMPSAHQKDSVELYVHKVPEADVEWLRSEMLPSTRDRFDHVWDLLFRPTISEPIVSLHSYADQHLTDADMQKLLECEIVKEVSPEELDARPTRGEVFPFTVIENRDTGERRRFLCWPKSQNAMLENIYVADIPVDHVASYAPRVCSPRALKRDLRCGFWQIAIPIYARARYRFLYGGKVYEVCRLLMGHVCAPELQHIVTATLAGHPHYARHSAPLGLLPDIYLDGIRQPGSESECNVYEEWLESRARRARVTFKDSDSYNGPIYTFLGLVYNHNTKTVCLSDSFLQKLPSAIPRTMTYESLQSLSSRLIYAATAMRTYTVDYYWAIKAIRRKISAYNRGLIQPGDTVTLSPIVQKELQLWLVHTRDNVPMCPLQTTAMLGYTLFTDASMDGWGGVLFTPAGLIYATGASWECHIDICQAEALAVERSLYCFESFIASSAHIDLRIDNTSVVFAIRKLWADAYPISRVLQRVIPFASHHGWFLNASYVHTSQNLADPWSRNAYGTWQQGV